MVRLTRRPSVRASMALLATAPLVLPAWAPADDDPVCVLAGDQSSERMAYVDVSRGQGDIVAVDGDGSDVVRVTSGPAHDAQPVWSPDGRRIAFERAEGGDTDVYVVDADGRNARNLAPDATDPARATDARPTWSPDGRWIAFHSDRTGDFEIFAVALDGSGLRNLTQRPGDPLTLGPRRGADVKPAWSPDGRWIAIESYRPSGPTPTHVAYPDIWIVDVTDPANARQITDTPAASEWFPEWSPDGATVVFQSNRTGAFDVWTASVDGSQPERNVTDHPKTDVLPRFSPDGTRIVYTSNAADGGSDLAGAAEIPGSPTTTVTDDLWVVNRDGSCPTRITRTGAAVNASYRPHDDGDRSERRSIRAPLGRPARVSESRG